MKLLQDPLLWQEIINVCTFPAAAQPLCAHTVCLQKRLNWCTKLARAWCILRIHCVYHAL